MNLELEISIYPNKRIQSILRIGPEPFDTIGVITSHRQAFLLSDHDMALEGCLIVLRTAAKNSA